MINAPRSRSRVSSCRFHAPSSFGASTLSTRSSLKDSSTPSSTTSVRRARPCSEDAPDQRSRAASRLVPYLPHRRRRSSPRAPKSVSRVESTPAPSASSSPTTGLKAERRTPCFEMRCSASNPPRPPVPPVMSAVPCGSIGAGILKMFLPTCRPWLMKRNASRA